MRQPELVFTSGGADGPPELVVNFGVYAGREATPAEIERLARDYLREVPTVEVICEQRYEFVEEAEATVYRIRVLTPGASWEEDARHEAVCAWAEDCIGERRVRI